MHGILHKKKKGNRNFYKIYNKEILEYISIREMNALIFLKLYSTKVLKDSDIYSYFEQFLNEPSSGNYRKMKNKFIEFTILNTNINKPTEPKRIFAKVINPIAFIKNSYGTERGNLSKNKITKDVLMYNRSNFRDIYSSKPKEITRSEYYNTLLDKPNINLIKYQSIKAKKLLRAYNDVFNRGKSEIDDKYSFGIATHMHHIFPESDFAEISGYIENIIALTPGQHFSEAHPNGNTRIVDETFQQICLLAKADSIEQNIRYSKEVIYSFDNFIYVLCVGLDDNSFENVENMDFIELIRLINMAYVYNSLSIAESGESYNVDN